MFNRVVSLLCALVFLCAAAPIQETYIPIPAQLNVDDGNNLTDPAAVDYPGVVRVQCDEGSGTAFRIAPRKFVTAAHVAALTNCQVDRISIHNVVIDGQHDVATFDADDRGPWRRLDCNGYKPGTWVYSVGYALGLDFQTGIPEYVTYLVSGVGSRVVMGSYTFIPGMSGGPVFDQTGAVVGVVDGYFDKTPLSYTQDLSATWICKK